MVKSNLDQKIEYKDSDKIEDVDMGYYAPYYEIELFKGYNANVALGNVSYKFVDNNVLYFPVYLIDDGYALYQIGVYEIFADKYTNLLDKDNDLDIKKLENVLPLYYSFFDEKFLKEKLNLNKNSQVLLLGCEGDVDEKLYQELLNK